MHIMSFGSWAQDQLAELKHSPAHLAVMGERGRQGKGRGKEKGGERERGGKKEGEGP